MSNEINLLGVTLDSNLKFDANVAFVCHKVGGQVNALNRLQNILSCKVKELLYRAFVPVSYTHLRAHETDSYLVCRLLLEKKNIMSLSYDHSA